MEATETEGRRKEAGQAGMNGLEEVQRVNGQNGLEEQEKEKKRKSTQEQEKVNVLIKQPEIAEQRGMPNLPEIRLEGDFYPRRKCKKR